MKTITGLSKLVLATLLVAIALTAFACTSDEPAERESVSVELDWYPNANHSGIFVAQDQGYFDDENLDVDVRPPADPALVAQIVASNERDFGIFYQTDTLLARKRRFADRSAKGDCATSVELADGVGIFWHHQALGLERQESRLSRHRVERQNARHDARV